MQERLYKRFGKLKGGACHSRVATEQAVGVCVRARVYVCVRSVFRADADADADVDADHFLDPLKI